MPPSNDLPDLTGLLVDDGRLRLLKIIGAGSYGVVYKALDALASPGTTVHYYAVKCLGAGTRCDTREIELHTACSPHPSVLTIHRHFYARGCLCVVLELAAGDLWTPIENGVFENNDALVKETFLDLLDAVRFLHKRGIYHRDLKPDNILCSADATNLRIADFGLAVDDGRASADPAGTACYMTPESLIPIIPVYDTPTHAPHQSDIWALCIILLNMMCGALPWLKASDADPGWQSFRASPTFLSRNAPISPELNALLSACLHPIPARRPSLLELRRAIAGMENLFCVSDEPGESSHLAVPSALGPPSAPSTEGTTLVNFHPSDYPSPSTSTSDTNTNSIFVDIVSVRSSCARSAAASTAFDIHALAAPPQRKPSRNPLKRFCRWLKRSRKEN